MSTTNSTYRRSYGSGSLYTREDANGRDTWYAHWRANGRQVKRRIGPKREDGTRQGMTRIQAERELRRLISETAVAPPVGERLDVAEVASRYLKHAERQGRKLSTRQDFAGISRRHLQPFFGERALDSISAADVADLVALLERKGLAAKTVRNVIATLSALFNFARAPRRGWAARNPCEGVELPVGETASEIRFLTLDEVDLLAANARRGPFEQIDRVLYLAAAATGLRLGELVALRWRDVDWAARRIRVRQSYVRGEFGTPKSKRSTRSVPMVDDLAGELERLFKTSRYQDDDELVFANPLDDGGPVPKANVTRRMHKALKTAGLDQSHVFHDLRHSYGTAMAAAGVPIRTLQEWMGHRDITTTQIYADYAPAAHEFSLASAALARGNVRGSNLSESQQTAAK